MLSRCLVQSGFHARRTVAIQALPKKGLDSLFACPGIQMLDSDAAYYHPGHTEFWA
jgi:hypothetical protein